MKISLQKIIEKCSALKKETAMIKTLFQAMLFNRNCVDDDNLTLLSNTYCLISETYRMKKNELITDQRRSQCVIKMIIYAFIFI